MKFFTISSLLFLFATLSGLSQTSDTISLNQVVVESIRIRNFNVGHQYITINPVVKDLYNTSYLNEILTLSSPLQVNSYGAGVSSISARGTGESRTPVLWNGFNLQNIMSAAVDVAQLPSSFFENIKIQMGGGSALFGSGAVGGVVNLSNAGEFNSGVHAEVSNYFGSFSQYAGNVKASYGNSHYATSLKYFYNKAKNDFPYEAGTADTLFKGRQSNAQAEQQGVMWNNFFLINTKESLNFHLWYQESDKNIAPSLSDLLYNSVTNASQKDKIARASAEWNHQTEKFSMTARTGLFNSKLDYTNPLWGSSNNKAFSSVTEFESSYAPISLIRMNGGVNYTYEEASASTFPSSHNRKRLGLFSSLRLEKGISQVGFNIRGESVNGKFIPLTYSAGIQENIRGLSLKANISRNYSLPPFNYLYFKDAFSEGNPNLKPETGYTYEAGFTFTKKFASASMILSSTFYHSDMKDWMKWDADSSRNIWTVKNIDRARINGLENSLELRFNIAADNLDIKLMHTYQDAFNKTLSKQVPYVPQNKFNGMLTWSHHDFSLMVQHSVLSSQYTNSLNSQSLKGYSLDNTAASWRFKVNERVKLAVDLQVNNIFNKNYLTIMDYPMPRRNFMAGVKFIF